MKDDVQSPVSDVVVYTESKNYLAMSNILVGYMSVLNSETPTLGTNSSNITEEEKQEFTTLMNARIEVCLLYIFFYYFFHILISLN